MSIKKNAIFIVLLFASITACAQQVDRVIRTTIYKSYYSYKVKNPLYVTYLLKKGGGDCDRESFSFHPCGERTADDQDYSGTGYDKGHLANAEDFAYSCSLDKLTFCYYSFLPQTVRLNRGIWKVWETKLRKLSQTRPLFMICGGNYSNRLLKPGHSVIIPDHCYKVVVDPPTGKTLFCLWFPNDDSGRVDAIDLATLKSRLHYPLVPENNLQ